MNSLKPGASDDFMFTRYSVQLNKDKSDYIVKKFGADGKKEVLEGEAKEGVLSGRSIAGSLGLTKDTKHIGILHVLIFIVQWLHALFTGQLSNFRGSLHKLDPDVCHGFITLGEARTSEGKEFPRPGIIPAGRPFRPTMCADPLKTGIEYTAFDQAGASDVTKVYYYMPKDQELAELIIDYATKTAFPKGSSAEKSKNLPLEQWKCYNPKCITDPSKKIPFNVNRLITCAWHNGREMVAEKPCKTVMRRTANMVANLMLDKPIVNDTICSEYATKMMQCALFGKTIRHVDTQAVQAFMSDKNGLLLSKEALVNKLVDTFSGKNLDGNDLAEALNQTFCREKFARVDGTYFMSYYLDKLGKEHSFNSRSRVDEVLEQAATPTAPLMASSAA